MASTIITTTTITVAIMLLLTTHPLATTMVFLGIRTSSPHSSAQRTLRPIPRIAQRPEPSEARTPALEEGGQFPESVCTLWAGFILTLGKGFRNEEESNMSEDQSVEEMAHEVLMRQAKARADRGVHRKSDGGRTEHRGRRPTQGTQGRPPRRRKCRRVAGRPGAGAGPGAGGRSRRSSRGAPGAPRTRLRSRTPQNLLSLATSEEGALGRSDTNRKAGSLILRGGNEGRPA
jgi:hypothetical protein